VLPLLATAALEKAINQCLHLDPDTLAKITVLEGKVIALDVQGLSLEIFLLPTANGLRVQSVFEGEPDVRIKGGVFSLARMGLSERPTSVIGDGVELEGDAELGRRVQSILDGLDIDWEEQLSRFSGDVIAHQVGNVARGLTGWGRNTANVFSQDVAEYLQEESRDLVVKEELVPFLDQVDSLRAGVDRLSQRVARLKTAQQPKTESEG
jgi:ubiquinone biosynthesis protein UbiJ